MEDGITDPAFEENCYETGFNVGDPNYVQARIGIVNLDNTGRRGYLILEVTIPRKIINI